MNPNFVVRFENSIISYYSRQCGCYRFRYGSVYVANGTTTINAGTFISKGSIKYYAASVEGGKLEIKGGKFSGNGYAFKKIGGTFELSGSPVFEGVIADIYLGIVRK